MGKSKGQQQSKGNSGNRSPGLGLLDRQMVKRVEAHVAAGTPMDVDKIADELRKSYREYQRIKSAPFRALIAKSVQSLRGRGQERASSGPGEEAALQDLESRHLAKARPSSSGTGIGASEGDGNSDSDGSDGSDPELDEEVNMEMAAAGGSKRLNSSLLSMYNRTAGSSPTTSAPAAIRGDAAAETPSKARVLPEEQNNAAALIGSAPGSAPGPLPLQQQQQVVAGEAPVATQQQQPQPPAAAAPEARLPPVSKSEPLSRQKTAADGTGEVSSRKRARREAGATGTERNHPKPSPSGAQKPTSQLRMSGSSSAIQAPTPVTYQDLGGIEGILDDITELIVFPMAHPEVYSWLGVLPPRGVLLHGPPGCGKTALANAIANECGVPFLRVSAPEIVSGMSGESEAKLRELFREAADNAPCIVFIDEIDAIAAKRETAQRQMEHRIVAQMLTCMDDLSEASRPPAKEQQQPGAGEGEAAKGGDGEGAEQHQNKHVVVVAATNRPDALDSALRRAGRFDREIAMGIPSEAARARILQVQTRKLRISGDLDFHTISKRTPGFVGADLAALVKEAAALAVKRCFQRLTQQGPELQEQQQQQGAAASSAAATAASGAAAADREAAAALERTMAWSNRARNQAPLTSSELEGLSITMTDFEEAVSKVQPSVRREGFATTPGVTWDDVGSLKDVREELSFAITEPIKFPKRFESMGLSAACGVLLFGPPGCGKTLVAKAVANESGANFISIKGPELLNKYVGESERAVRQLFTRARAAAPCVLFFDELDALAPRRGGDGNQAAERVVNQLLTEMDGIDGRQAVYLVAATNRPDMIDPALLRPGRLDKLLYVPLPTADSRLGILQTLARKTPLAPGVDLGRVAEIAHGFSGADMAALVREACINAMREGLTGEAMTDDDNEKETLVEQRHFETAVANTNPSVSSKDQRVYNALRNKLKSSRGRLGGASASAAVAIDADEATAAAPSEGATAPMEGTSSPGLPEQTMGGDTSNPMDE